jgi:phospholipid/cholesterol/gamma-HCH transport system substrate-binding protein
MRKIALALVSCVIALTACSSGAEMIRATAEFTDVGDLAKDAPVMLADIQIGEVTDIQLKGNVAVVTFEVERDAEVPEGVTARVRRTSVLGERIVDLVLPEDLDADTPLLADGAHLDNTEVRSDLEDLVAEGSDVLGAIAASDLAVMIQEGGRGFGGQGARLRALLRNYEDIVAAYDEDSDEIVSLIDSMGSFNRKIAARADAHYQALENSARSIEVLKEESADLEDAVIALNRLAVGGKAILEEHSDEMTRFFSQMRTILDVLVNHTDDIETLLKYAPGHNENTQRVEYAEFNQVVQEFVICGLNDDPNDRARRCTEHEE